MIVFSALSLQQEMESELLIKKKILHNNQEGIEVKENLNNKAQITDKFTLYTEKHIQEQSITIKAWSYKMSLNCFGKIPINQVKINQRKIKNAMQIDSWCHTTTCELNLFKIH